MEVDEALQDYNGNGFFAYSRDISDLHKLSTRQNAGRYMDLDESHTHLDKTKQVRLHCCPLVVVVITKKFNCYCKLEGNLQFII